MKTKNKGILLILLGAASGLLNGLLGAGGGILLIRGIDKLRDGKGDARDAFAGSLSVMLPISAVSAIIYALRGNIIEIDVLELVLPAVIGGATGGLLLYKMDIRILKLVFSALVIWSGISMLF